MIACLDTSALLKLIVDEDGTPEASRIVGTADRVLVSRLSYPEARSALGAMARDGRLSSVAYQTAIRSLERRLEEMVLLDVEEFVARLGGLIAERHAVKGCDAVHVATALSVGDPTLVFATWDAAQSRAARAEGLIVGGVRP